MATVYVHINKINQKLYFGRSNSSAENRWGNNGIGYKGQKFYSEGIEKFGWENFAHLILADDITPAQSIALETYLITEYNTIEQGYNETKSICTNEALEEIKQLGEHIKSIISNFSNDGILVEESLETLSQVSYRYGTTTYRLRNILPLWQSGQISTDLDVQRGLVWNDKQQQEMWDTLLYSARIPEIHTRRENGSKYSVMDGKQRLTTCMYILTDKIPLKKNTLRNEKHRRYLENHNKTSIVFSELPRNLRETILDIPINFAEYYDMSDNEMADLFKKLNNGTSLTSFQKTISQNYIFRQNTLIPIINYSSLFQSPFFSEKKREKNEDEQFVLKVLYLFSMDTIENKKLEMRPEDAQKMIDYVSQENLTLATSKLIQLLTVFDEYNITYEDFERGNKRTGAEQRINDMLRPFIFYLFINNLDKKQYFKEFLTKDIFSRKEDDRMSPATAQKYYKTMFEEFNKLLLDK